MFAKNQTPAKADPELWNATQNENRRQENRIELFASQNYASDAVLQTRFS